MESYLTLEFNSMNYCKFQFHEKIRFEFHKYFCNRISLLLISISGCDNKSSTISVWPLSAAQLSYVAFNVRVKFH